MSKAQQERRWPSPANGGDAAVNGPAAVAAAAARARLPRVMPHWVSATGRSAVPPPPPPTRPEPDYEVIEFPSDQYVNAKLNPAPRSAVIQHCGLCGAPGARVRCHDCEGRVFCVSCDDMYHRHPKRRSHRRQPIAPAPSDDSDRPPLPPKGANAAPAPPPPVPPPRRNKVGGRSDSFSSRGSRTPAPASPQPPTTPAHLRRPLPATPAAPPHLRQHAMVQQSAADANNTWNRPSSAASFASPPSSPRPMQHAHDPQAWPSNGGGWSATVDRRRSAGGPPKVDGGLRRAPIASSVFELHRPEPHPQQQLLMQQQRFLPAQSMATLSCASCAGCQQQRAAAGGDWWRYGSNASLDARMPHDGFGQPGMWVNPWLPPMPMYPHTHHTTGRPASRAHSRVASRAVSPAASVRSRRSRHGTRRYREPDDYSDDEDSSGERRPRRRDSLRSHTRATPSPIPRETPASRTSPGPVKRQDDRDLPRRNGTIESTRRESTSSHTRRESPMRMHVLRESPIRSHPAEISRRIPTHKDAEPPRFPQSTHKMEATRIPQSPINRRNVLTSPTNRARSSSSEERSQEAETTAPTLVAEDALDAPPPPIPTARWQCEYCTYVNEPGTRVCEICCKTPTAPPQPASADRSTPTQTTELAAATERLTISEPVRASVELVFEKPKKGDDDYKNVPVSRAQDVAESTTEATAEPSAEMASLGVKRVKKKTVCEKVSTGCGPSPPRETPPSPAPSPIPTAAAPHTPGTASTGTSPLPQSISTQTYESPEEIRQAAAASIRPTSSTADESSRSTRRRSARSLRREARRSSRRSPDHTSRSERSHSRSRHSFSSDRSIGTPAREWSPAPAPPPDEEWWREAGPLRSRSNSLMQQQRPRTTAPPRRAPPRRASHLDLYKEREDPRWRRDPFGDPYAYPDPRDMYGSQPDVTRAISLETLAAARRQTDVIRNQGLELVKLLREAEASGFTAEEVHAATQQCGNTDPVRWLQENWAGMVASVQTVASKLGRESGSGDTVGTVSEKEAREALRRHKGSVWQAVTDCVQQRQRKYGDLMSRGKFSREEVLTCLTAHHGDLEAAYLDLTKNQLKPFLMKIWGPPEGVENDSANPQAGPSGALSAPHQQSLGFQKSKDEHVIYLDKLKKFETILNKDANVHDDDSVSGNNNPFADHNPQVSKAAASPKTSVPETSTRQDAATDNILGGLKSLLSRIGIPVSDQSLLNGLKSIMNIGDHKSKNQRSTCKSEGNESQYQDMIETENDFIQAYNALTSSSPLPSIEPPTYTNKQHSNENLSSISNLLLNNDTVQNNFKHLSSNERSDNQNEITSNIFNITSSSVTKDNNVIGSILEIPPSISKTTTGAEISNIEKTNSQTNNKINVALKESPQPPQSALHEKTITNENLNSIESNKNQENTDDKSQHLSDIVTDTHRLVQQMKEEINSDIASYDEGGHSESENESSVTPNSSERDSYTETRRSSSGSESEESEEFTEESDETFDPKEVIFRKSQQSTSSDENEQFEQAIDNSEPLNYEESNMARLDAIVKSLQEIDNNFVKRNDEIISPARVIEDTNTRAQFNDTVENNIMSSNISSINESFIESAVAKSTNRNSFIEPEIATAILVVAEVEIITEPLISRQSSVAHEPVFTAKTIEPEVTPKTDATTEEKIIENDVFDNTLISVNNNYENNNTIVHNNYFGESSETHEYNNQEELTEDFNNNSLPVKTFEELYDSLSIQSSVSYNHNGAINRSPTPEVIIEDDIQASQRAALTMETKNNETENSNNAHSGQLNNIFILSVNNNTDDLPRFFGDSRDLNDEANLNIELHSGNTPEKITTTTSSENKLTNSSSHSSEAANKEPSENVKQKTITSRVSEEGTKSANGTEKLQPKSSIPKPKSNLGYNKAENKPPTKVILSKVPIRKNSLKSPTSPPTSQKSHFGNIQSGHVKKLQSSLFGKNEPRNPKIPVPVRKKSPPKTGLALVKPMPSKIITIQSDNSAEKAKLKPYFQETCLSDDYLTETDDEAVRKARSPMRRTKSEPDVIKISEPEQESFPVTSRLVNGKIVDFTQVPLKDGSPERQMRMLVAEGVVESWQQAEVAVALAARGETPAAALLAAHDCVDLPAAIAYLKQECELCAGHAPAFEMVSMLSCTHRCCSECANTYFTVQITERSIFDCVCPFCKLPELAAATNPGSEDHEDEAVEYFSRLEHQLKSVVATGVHELFQRKLRDRALLQDPNFKWCVECSSGFFVHPRQKRITCPECRSVTCAKCRKQWEKQHEGLSCEQFSEWKEANDPETSVAAVQRHLQDNGIDCPKCKFRYSLARGGCMHFTCSQCKYEFCCGCGKPFTMGARCGLSEYCAKLGLHAHHPRNCLFYLRDKEPHQLQTLLQMNNIDYKTEPADGSEDQAATGELTGEKRPRRCPVALQRETPGGLVDTTCNGDVPPQHAGLCKAHYLEHLASVVMAHAVDPLPVMDVWDLIAELRRRAIPLPERGPWDTDPIYAGMCAEIVKEKIPLDE